MPEGFEDPQSRLLDLSAALTAVMLRSIQESFRRVLNSREIRNIEELVQSGRFLEAMGIGEDLFAPASRVWTDIMVRAADDTADLLRAFRLNVDFDRVNERAVRVMRENQLRLVRELADAQREAIRLSMVQSIERGLNPRDAARLIRGSIGLTGGQVQMVENYRLLLERGSAEALTRRLRDRRFDPTLRSGRPLTTQQITRMVDRYRERALVWRSETIARTEALAAVHVGAEQMYREAVFTGVLSENDILRTWRPARDERVRESHSAMRGQQRTGLSDPFISGNGNRLRYPADPAAPASDRIQCRCGVSVRLRAIG